ncbi:hypothetical protein Salat_0835800, partial [Sesamum alatum]
APCFHHDRMNCHAVLCALFDINARFGSTLSYSYCQRKLEKLKIRYRVFSWITRLVVVEWDPKTNHISADDYTWEQIATVKSIGKANVNAVEPQWTALWILFGEITTINDWDDEDVFFDRAGTCVDDGWVHNGNAPSDDTSYESPNDDTTDNDNDDPSWWAFIQEYYASDSGTGSVNIHPARSANRRLVVIALRRKKALKGMQAHQALAHQMIPNTVKTLLLHTSRSICYVINPRSQKFE